MDALFVAINAKYIHLNPAVRALQANSRFSTDFREFTIHDDLDAVVASILEASTPIIGISTYIWNVSVVRELVGRLREKTTASIVLGGPEVAYDAEHFLKTLPIDYVVTGEGEAVIDDLIAHILYRAKRPTHNLAYLEQDKVVEMPRRPLEDLSTLKNAYGLSEEDDLRHRIVYVESSRGCPYRCTYCLSSKERGVRFFPVDTVLSIIKHISQRGARTIKFLDRTFNANPNTLRLLEGIIASHVPGQTYQFEITGDVLDPKVIDFIHNHAPKGLFRFEIGIQSTHEATNRSVERIQNTDKLFDIIRRIRARDIIDLHLDLIAGLPLETLTRFKQTFNEVYGLGARELQLGFLKMLRGTKIRQEADRYGYVYDEQPPYEIHSHHDLSVDEIARIKRVETALNAFHNKQHIGDTLPKIVAAHGDAFSFFENLHAFAIGRGFDFHRFQMHELYGVLDAFMETQSRLSACRDTLKQRFVERFSVKPRCYFPLLKRGLHHSAALHEASKRLKLPRDAVSKHAVVFETTEHINVAYYQNGTCRRIEIKKRPL